MTNDTPPQTAGTTPWWRRAAVYQVYPRSFADGNGDGTGDVAGIASRLPYLQRLGVDAIWISPWYLSPLNDGGYDVADFRQIDPRFGDNADAEAMIARAHELGIKVIVDLVPNHTSSEHVWFRAALDSGPGSAERDRYIFREGRGPDGSEPPTNWRSVFGGPAWTRVDDGQWYLHLFDPTQPDLNWTNDEVLTEYDDIFRFWIERGVDGFRIDVAHGLMKDPAYPDLETETELLGASEALGHPHWDRDEVHDVIRRWRRVLDEADREVMMVAEAWVHPSRLHLYLRPDEYHQSFNFDFLGTAWDGEAARAAIERALTAAQGVGSTPTWTLSNHDVMRHATRYGLPTEVNWRTWPLDGPHDVLDQALGLRRAKAATLLLMALPGSVYIYQGEELGLPEVWDLPPEVLDDPVWQNSGHRMKGRDGCRVPIPWTADGQSYGFGSGPAWLPQPASFGPLSVESQTDDPNSTLALYRSVLDLRRTWFVDDEEFTWVDVPGADEHVVAFRRGSGAVCIVNFGQVPIEIPEGTVLASSEPLDGRKLPDNAAVWLAP